MNMGIAMAFGVVLIALAIAAVMLWGAFETLVRAVRFLWRLLVPAPSGNLMMVGKGHGEKPR